MLKLTKEEHPTKMLGDVPFYYEFGNCLFECKYKGDYFFMTNGEVEFSKSEKELENDPIAIKHFYSGS